MQWNANIELLLAMLMAGEALILDAVDTTERWSLRVLFPNRDALTAANEVCESHDLAFNIRTIRELDGAPPQSVQRLRAGLTDEQVEALTIAFERGYFEVPRRTSLKDLAAEFDISHQALSERLRRGHNALLADTLCFGPSPLTTQTDVADDLPSTTD